MCQRCNCFRSGTHLNIKMLSYQYRNSHYEYKTVTTVLSLEWISPYLEKPPLYWDGARMPTRSIRKQRWRHVAGHQCWRQNWLRVVISVSAQFLSLNMILCTREQDPRCKNNANKLNFNSLECILRAMFVAISRFMHWFCYETSMRICILSHPLTTLVQRERE